MQDFQMEIIPPRSINTPTEPSHCPHRARLGPELLLNDYNASGGHSIPLYYTHICIQMYVVQIYSVAATAAQLAAAANIICSHAWKPMAACMHVQIGVIKICNGVGIARTLRAVLLSTMPLCCTDSALSAVARPPVLY